MTSETAEITNLHRRLRMLQRGYVLFALCVIAALIAIGALVNAVHSAQTEHFHTGQTERALMLQQNGEILQILRSRK